MKVLGDVRNGVGSGTVIEIGGLCGVDNRPVKPVWGGFGYKITLGGGLGDGSAIADTGEVINAGKVVVVVIGVV